MTEFGGNAILGRCEQFSAQNSAVRGSAHSFLQPFNTNSDLPYVIMKKVLVVTMLLSVIALSTIVGTRAK